MPLDAKDVSKLVKGGTVFGCAACIHLHEALDAGADVCGKECGSPINGDLFPLYEGPVSDDYWPEVCWVCGKEADIGIHFVTRSKTLGACHAHNDAHERSDSNLGTVFFIGDRVEKKKENLIQDLLRTEND